MQTVKSFVADQLKLAKEGADNLARRHGYSWTAWLKRPNGRCTAAFEREGERWSLDFYWTPREDLSVLADNIEKMDHLMQVAMKEFGALKTGAFMRQVRESVIH
jgi:uncharacterized protein YebE (UPF0316 family)